MRQEIRVGSIYLAAVCLVVVGCSDSTIPEEEPPPSGVWARSAGGLEPENGRAVATDGSGNLFVAGEFNGSATFETTTLTSAGSSDVFVAKYDVGGALLWAQSAGGSEQDAVSGCATDGQGNVFVAGNFRGSADFGGTTLTSGGEFEVYIAKYDAEGILLWARSAGNWSGWVRGVATDGSGNVIVTGYFEQTATFGGTDLTSTGHYDVFVAKYDAAGALLWANSGGGGSIDEGFGVVADGSGNVIVTGFFNESATFGETTLTGLPGYLEWDVFVAKYDAAGALLWVQSAGGALLDVGRAVAVDGSGNVIVTGSIRGSADFGGTTLTSAGELDVFVAKYDAEGVLLWAKSAGGTADDEVKAISVDGSGNAVVTGSFVNSAAFGSTTLTGGGYDVFVAKYAVDGMLLWAHSAGGPQWDTGAGVAVDESGKVLVTGSFKDSAAFGGTTLTSMGSWDVFVTKMSSSGF